MAEFFDSKVFNPEVFGKYIDRIEDTHLKMLIKSGAIVVNNDIKNALTEQTGGYKVTTPIKGRIDGATPENYDGKTNLTASSTPAYAQTRVVAGRGHGFVEKDYTYDITGGYDPMKNVADQTSDWQDMNRQNEVLAILDGIFGVSGFSDKHTLDATAITNANGQTGFADATTFNTGMQKSCGDKKKKFAFVFMDSTVATNLENQNLLTYIKMNDANGMQRDTDFATLNGKLVLVDDDMPTYQKKTADAVAGVYKVTISTALASGDSVEIAGVEYEFTSGTTTASAQATAIAAAINADTEAKKIYTAVATSDYVTLTENTGYEGTGAPEVDDEGLTTGVVALTTTTVGKAATYVTVHVSYILGNGAIEYTDCGVKTPYAMSRDEATNGGQDTLWVRQRDCFAPYGFSFTESSMNSTSATDTELATADNWELVYTNSGSGKSYINDKIIPIARVLTLG